MKAPYTLQVRFFAWRSRYRATFPRVAPFPILFFEGFGNGHTTLKVGPGLLVYAGKEEAQLGTYDKNRKTHGAPTFRHYEE